MADSEQPTVTEPSSQGIIQVLMWAIGGFVLIIAVVIIVIVLVVIVAKKCGKDKASGSGGGDLWVTLPDDSETKSEASGDKRPLEEKTTVV